MNVKINNSHKIILSKDYSLINKIQQNIKDNVFDDIFVLSRFRNILLTVKNENDERFNILDS